MSHFLKNKAVFISGINGFLGSHIAGLLSCHGARVIGLTRNPDKINNRLKKNENIKFVKGDLGNASHIKNILKSEKVEYLFHLAGMSVVSQCEENPQECYQSNVLGTKNILEAARINEGLRAIVCIDSLKPIDATPLEYSKSKLAAALIIDEYYEKYNLPLFSVKSTQIYGPGDRHFERLIPKTIFGILNGKGPTVYESAKDLQHEYLYVLDSAKIMISLVEKISQVRGRK